MTWEKRIFMGYDENGTPIFLKEGETIEEYKKRREEGCY